jgi:hypothetical protein
VTTTLPLVAPKLSQPILDAQTYLLVVSIVPFVVEAKTGKTKKTENPKIINSKKNGSNNFFFIKSA